MKKLCLIFILFYSFLGAQDKLYFKSGILRQGRLVSVGAEFVYFRNNDTAATYKVNRADLVMIEDYKGKRYLFAEHEKDEKKGGADPRRNIFSAQPLGLLVGRATVVYERLNKKGNIGFVFPLSITFDPYGSLYKERLDTTAGLSRNPGVKFITGADLNFYLGDNQSARFFIGPRFRYGTDLFLRNVEGYTLQTQLGWKFGTTGSPFVQHLSFGFGFVRLTSTPVGLLIDPRQSYGWFSFNYRVGLTW